MEGRAAWQASQECRQAPVTYSAIVLRRIALCRSSRGGPCWHCTYWGVMIGVAALGATGGEERMMSWTNAKQRLPRQPLIKRLSSEVVSHVLLHLHLKFDRLQIR